ncbi:tetratricopeptide repeat protein [Lacinutrix cladophorae]
MNTANYKLLFILLLVLTSCNKSLDKITSVNDYNTYLKGLESETLQTIQGDHDFWENKLEKEPNQYPYLVKLAASQSQLFTATGNIDYLILAEESLIKANEKINYTNSGYLRALARNYISQHRFKEALNLLEKAETIGENLKGTQKMLFDVHLELGNTKKASHYLAQVKDLSDFGFLIRLSKWSDHEGDLSATIKYMEKAMAIAESSKNKALMQWAYTNIADYYGHDGQIEKSYHYYLKALAINPNEAYAKKGIAWIVYSYERNPQEAIRILNTIAKQHQAPDYYLLKAEIAEYMNDKTAKTKYLTLYANAVNNTKYGDMYNAYNAKLFAEELNLTDQALKLSREEIDNRPTAQSYDLLAWTYYNKGHYENALHIAEDNVLNKTFEPEAMYHLAKIYKANGKISEAKKLKKELLESSFELGPLVEKEIKNI